MVIDVTPKAIIGTIDLTEHRKFFQEMDISTNNSKPNLSGKYGSCEVAVYQHEGPIPHVHVTSPNGIGTCVCLHGPYYFNHGTSKMKNGTFNSKQSRIFDDWMRATSSRNSSMTNYQYAVFEWMRNYKRLYGKMYDENGISFNVQPDYSHMRGNVTRLDEVL